MRRPSFLQSKLGGARFVDTIYYICPSIFNKFRLEYRMLASDSDACNAWHSSILRNPNCYSYNVCCVSHFKVFMFTCVDSVIRGMQLMWMQSERVMSTQNHR